MQKESNNNVIEETIENESRVNEDIIKRKLTNSDREQQQGVVNLLRICTVALAMVSFWATAQGMSEYVFSEKWQAYMASFAVQGILLGLNFFLPFFLGTQKLFQKMILISLTLVALFCSSWFSYLYIVNQTYEESWEVESHLLIQDTYRQELFSAKEYTVNYKKKLEEDLSKQILELHSKSYEIEIEKTENEIVYDWQAERDIYLAEDFALKDDMELVIGRMEKATQEDADKDDIERAESIVDQMLVSIDEELQIINSNIESMQLKIENAANTLNRAQETRNNATEGGDVDALDAAVSSASNVYNNLNKENEQLDEEKRDYDEARKRLNSYQSYLELLQGESYTIISDSLMEIQTEMFQENPDAEIMIEDAIIAFESLQDNTNFKEENYNEYMLLLNDLNSFIDNLDDYQLIKESDEKLQQNIEGLENTLNSEFEELSSKRKEESEQKENVLFSDQKMLNDLKLLISKLPDYIDEDNELLKDYDKALSTKNIDNVIRNYIADHNSAQKGIIYLFSPYNELALFSVILAFFLDIAAFVTGAIIYYTKEAEKDVILLSDNQGGSLVSNNPFLTINNPIDSVSQMEWNIVSGLNRYVFFVGDYTKIDNEYTYHAIVEGKDVAIKFVIENSDNIPIKAGMYKQENEEYVVVCEQELAYKTSKVGAKDGVYFNSFYKYEDSMLSRADSKDGEYMYIANIDESIPVYYIVNGSIEVFSADQLNRHGGTVSIVSLNKQGTRVIAIYIVEI